MCTWGPMSFYNQKQRVSFKLTSIIAWNLTFALNLSYFPLSIAACTQLDTRKFQQNEKDLYIYRIRSKTAYDLH